MAPTPRATWLRRDRSPKQDSDSSASSGSSVPQRPVMINPRKAAAASRTAAAAAPAPPSNPLRPRPQNTLQREPDTSDSSSASSITAKPIMANPYKTRPSAPRTQPNGRPFAGAEPWKGWNFLSVILTNVPDSWGTLEIHNLLKHHGASPDRIDMTYKSRQAKVIFRPPPFNAPWLRSGLNIILPSDRGTVNHQISCRPEDGGNRQENARQPGQSQLPEELFIAGTSISFGFMSQKNEMIVMRQVGGLENVYPRMLVNLYKQQMELHFSLRLGPEGRMAERHFMLRIPFTQLSGISEERTADGDICLVIPLETPPMVFRKTSRVEDTHDPKIKVWAERQAWYRQTSIDVDARTGASRKTKLQNEDSFIDIGRCLSHRFVCQRAVSQASFEQLRTALARHNITIRRQPTRCAPAEGLSHWNWLDNSNVSAGAVTTSFFDQMSSETVHLPFAVRYQMEACISQGCLHESNLNVIWAKRLLELDLPNPMSKDLNKHPKATKLLERVLEFKQRFYNPMDVFELLVKVNLAQKKVPQYCTMVRSATVTATTIYFNNPSMDTSNRVIRQFSQHEDRFLRVMFRDESYKGSIMNFDDNTCDELFTRVKRTMKNGIVVGDRHYEFLAYGNSQFREHGAYFFAPTSALTTEMIREWMGNFEGIKTVAKYASRIGQCFSTTRAMPNSVVAVRIKDIEKNGYCFSDGVGKISLFLAQITAQEMGLSSFSEDCPSVFQFRLGGLKGVLAVDPSLKGQHIEVRPSQEKFPAPYRGLEICRISQFSTAYLNQQIVLVLSALGVPDEVFLRMLRRMLSGLESAIDDESVAFDLLLRNIDLNQSTVQLASMITDGFMATQDPFFVSCQRLWRSWSIKYLKEKAKIFVEKGAFVLGCVDETGILKGHYNSVPSSDFTHDISLLPEIFLQIPDPELKGKFKVVEGVCTLARNPSLHPGDTRVVHAVDVPQLRHLRNCVVLPSTGDRDIASMCSGGDLDGDDYLVMWEPDLLPDEWNHAPMDYTAPPPVISDGPVTVNDMTSFFVTHMKNDNLARIAVAHRYWADKMEDGVKHDNCLELAALHSMAVDYAKSGVPAEMPSGRTGLRRTSILGRLYDEVDRVPFVPAWELAFDERILEAYKIDDAILAVVRDTKRLYDEAIRRLMTQHGVKTEFEIWTTFILEHNHESRDFKMAEELGEAVAAVKRQFQDACYEAAGTTQKDRDWEKLKLWVAAMYTVTAQEMAAANAECENRRLVGGQWVPQRYRTAETMPLISFPWLFQRELGMIAKRRDGALSLAMTAPTVHTAGKAKSKLTITEFQGNGVFLEPLPIIPPSISTEDEAAENLTTSPELEILSLTKDHGRKDSCTEDQSTPEENTIPISIPIQQETQPPIVNTVNTANTANPIPTITITPPLLNAKALGFAPPDIQVGVDVLAESSAFDLSDLGCASREFAEINALPALPSGEYEEVHVGLESSEVELPVAGTSAMAIGRVVDEVVGEAEDVGEQVSPVAGMSAMAIGRVVDEVVGEADCDEGKQEPAVAGLSAMAIGRVVEENLVETDSDEGEEAGEQVTIQIEKSSALKGLSQLEDWYGF